MTDTVEILTLLESVNGMPLRKKLNAGTRGCLAAFAAQQGMALCSNIGNKALGALPVWRSASESGDGYWVI
jgi:hypothetical protein